MCRLLQEGSHYRQYLKLQLYKKSIRITVQSLENFVVILRFILYHLLWTFSYQNEMYMFCSSVRSSEHFVLCLVISEAMFIPQLYWYILQHLFTISSHWQECSVTFYKVKHANQLYQSIGIILEMNPRERSKMSV